MNRFFTLLLAASCLTAVGQVTYPYNPDGNADGDIAVGDLQDFLVKYGNPFSPSEILVGDTTLSEWVQYITTELQNIQQNQGNNDGEASSLGIGPSLEIQVDYVEGQAHSYGSYNWFFYSLEFQESGFLTLSHGGPTRILRVAKSDSLDLLDYSTGVALIETPSDFYYSADWGSSTIPVHSSKKVILMNAGGNLGKATWTSVQQSQIGTQTNNSTSSLELQVDSLKEVVAELIDARCGGIIEWQGVNYPTAEINGRCWFGKNLSYLPQVYERLDASSSEGRYYVFGYEGNDVTVARNLQSFEEWGVYYNQFAISNEQLCPTGWHVANSLDWKLIGNYYWSPTWNGTDIRYDRLARYLKSDSSCWASGIHTNESNLNLIPSGRITTFEGSGASADHCNSFITMTPEPNWLIVNTGDDMTLKFGELGAESYACPIRCVKDAE